MSWATWWWSTTEPSGSATTWSASPRTKACRYAAVERCTDRAGDVIEAWGESVPVADPVSALAFHASGSGIPDRIVKWNREAAEAAIAKGAMEIAESLLRDVVAAQRQTSAESSACLATYRRLAFAAERAGHPEPAFDALTQPARLADERERALIAVDRARMLEKLGRYRAALVTTASRAEDLSGHPSVRPSPVGPGDDSQLPG